SDLSGRRPLNCHDQRDRCAPALPAELGNQLASLVLESRSEPVLAALALRRRQQVGCFIDYQEHGTEGGPLVLRQLVPAVEAIPTNESLPGLPHSHEVFERLHLISKRGDNRHVEAVEPRVLTCFL